MGIKEFFGFGKSKAQLAAEKQNQFNVILAQQILAQQRANMGAETSAAIAAGTNPPPAPPPVALPGAPKPPDDTKARLRQILRGQSGGAFFGASSRGTYLGGSGGGSSSRGTFLGGG